MPHFETLNLSEENKENIPPSILQKDLSNLTNYFDCKFKDYQDYLNYFRTYLTNWIEDPSYHSFKVHYCQHHLLTQQCKDFDDLIKETQKMREYTAQIDHTQLHNAQQMLLSLSANGIEAHFLEVKQPKIKKSRKQEPLKCSICQLCYVYDHVAWCWGQTDGYTCQCSL